jgi:hypothetical protein
MATKCYLALNHGNPAMYKVLKQLGNGQFVDVTSFDNLEEAVELIQELNATWPGAYIVRDSAGRKIYEHPSGH